MWIRIRIETNADPQHGRYQILFSKTLSTLPDISVAVFCCGLHEGIYEDDVRETKNVI